MFEYDSDSDTLIIKVPSKVAVENIDSVSSDESSVIVVIKNNHIVNVLITNFCERHKHLCSKMEKGKLTLDDIIKEVLKPDI